MSNTVHVSRPEDARTLWVLGDQVRFMGQLEGSNLHVLEVVVPPGSGTPPHRHASVEIFRVSEGEVTFGFYGEDAPENIVAGPGTVVTVPSNVGHNYRNTGATPAAMTSIIESQMVNFFQDVGTAMAPPPGPPSSDVIEQVMAACVRHGIGILSTN